MRACIVQQRARTAVRCSAVGAAPTPEKPVPAVASSGSRRLLLAGGAATGLAGVLCACCPPPLANATEWSYDPVAGPWPGTCIQGSAQSPVDIPPLPATPAPSPFGRIRLRYPFYTKATCTNNGHGSPQINLPGDVMCEIGGAQYDLVQVHWHCASEHSIGGMHAPMEAHLVHRAQQGGGYAVLAVLMHLGAANSVLQTALDSAPAEPGGGVPTRRAVSLQSLLPPPRGVGGLRPYATYEGSLTTPPCSERVQWFVFLDPGSVSPLQVVEFEQFAGGGRTLGRNDRPQQPLNGRTVSYYL